MLTHDNDFYNKLFVNILLIIRFNSHKLSRALKFVFFRKNLKNVLTKGQAYDIILKRQVKRTFAGVVQWQNSSLPSWPCGFDSHHPLLRKRRLCTFSSAG